MLDKNMLETSKKNAILINYSEDENREKLPKGRAVEMYGYCLDIDQSYDTLGKLAGSLVNSSVWYFWWD